MSLSVKKAGLTGKIRASRKLPAGAGKFPPVGRGNRRKSIHAEIFDCIRRYFLPVEKFTCGLRGYICTRQFYSVVHATIMVRSPFFAKLKNPSCWNFVTYSMTYKGDNCMALVRNSFLALARPPLSKCKTWL